MRKRPAFTAIELLLVVAIVGVIGGISIMQYRHFHVHNLLVQSEDQTRNMLGRAQLLSQNGHFDDTWGVHVPTGTVFKGSSFITRDPAHDELYPFSTSVTVSGIQEVVFSRLYGEPNVTGDIVLTSLLGEQRLIGVPKVIGGPQTVTLPGTNVRVRIVFEKVKNNGNGSAEAATYVGLPATRYDDGEWIDVVKDGVVLSDTAIEIAALGLALQRTEDYLKIMAYGGLDSGGKEVVDARIYLEGATVDRVDNELGDHEMEQPFDGNVNDGVGGDEVTVINSTTVLFQTRVTNGGDTLLLYYTPDPIRWTY